MANQLAVDKSFAMNNLRSAGYSKRRIAQTLGVSRGAVRRHLQALNPNSTTVPQCLSANRVQRSAGDRVARLKQYQGVNRIRSPPHRITSGQMEGTNNKVKTVQRQAYGLRDHEYFKLVLHSLHLTKYALVG